MGFKRLKAERDGVCALQPGGGLLALLGKFELGVPAFYTGNK